MNVKKILVSQPKPEAGRSPYFDIAEKYGVELVFRPFIKVEGLSAKEFRQSRVNILDFTAIIFTARTAVDHFFNMVSELRLQIPDTMKYFCTSEAIALYLQKYIVYRKRKVFFAPGGNFDSLIPVLVKHKKEKFLWVVSDVHKEDSSMLDKSGINYTKVVMYRTVSNDFTPDEPFDYDMLIFFSPAGIDSLTKNFPDFKQGDIRIATFGATTGEAARNAGLELAIEAPTPQYPSMTGALAAYLEGLQKEEA